MAGLTFYFVVPLPCDRALSRDISMIGHHIKVFAGA